MPPRCGPSRVQSLIFPRSRFTPAGVAAWIREHPRFTDSFGLDVKPNTIRVRQVAPSQCCRAGGTIKLGKSGIQAYTCPMKAGSEGLRGLDATPGEYPEGVLLHGSAYLFDAFKHDPHGWGGHGLIYFSDPAESCFFRRRTQAEAIAERGGYLYEVRLRGGREFNPYTDPIARRIAEPLSLGANNGTPGDLRIPYENAPDLVQAAVPLGYQIFPIYESAVRCSSVAVSDPRLIQILNVRRVKP